MRCNERSKRSGNEGGRRFRYKSKHDARFYEFRIGKRTDAKLTELLLAKLRIQDVAQGVTEQIKPEHCRTNR